MMTASTHVAPVRGTARAAGAIRALLLLTLAVVFAGGCGAVLSDAVPGTRQPAAPRIVAFGDVHGDLAATRRALELAGAIDAQARWIGGNLVVVQTGDQLDRGDDERDILHLFERLAGEARQAGGAFHVLNGNHELMNADLDLRYVTPGGFRAFEGAVREIDPNDPLLAEFPPEQHARVAAFRPGGPYARMLARRNTILIVGETVFVHGGVLPHHVEYGIDRINAEVRAWLRGEAERPEISIGSDSPIWTRIYSMNVDDAACTTAATVLGQLGARRMVVGHTVHRTGITSYCDGRIWAIDVGLAEYYRGVMQVLEIRGDTVRALSER
jgi:hypothetical protein